MEKIKTLVFSISFSCHWYKHYASSHFPEIWGYFVSPDRLTRRRACWGLAPVALPSATSAIWPQRSETSCVAASQMCFLPSRKVSCLWRLGRKSLQKGSGKKKTADYRSLRNSSRSFATQLVFLWKICFRRVASTSP